MINGKKVGIVYGMLRMYVSLTAFFIFSLSLSLSYVYILDMNTRMYIRMYMCEWREGKKDLGAGVKTRKKILCTWELRMYHSHCFLHLSLSFSYYICMCWMNNTRILSFSCFCLLHLLYIYIWIIDTHNTQNNPHYFFFPRFPSPFFGMVLPLRRNLSIFSNLFSRCSS